MGAVGTVVTDNARTARLDLRLTPGNRLIIEQAAALAGTNLSDYVTTTTLSAARREIATARTFYLDQKAWTEFLAILDEPDTPAMEQLRTRPTRWDN